MRVFGMVVLGAAAIAVVSASSPASAQDARSAVRTPEDAWRLQDQARRYHRPEEQRYWQRYAEGLVQQRRERHEPVPQYHGWNRYEQPIDPDEAYRLEDQARRFNRPGTGEYWRRYREGLQR